MVFNPQFLYIRVLVDSSGKTRSAAEMWMGEKREMM
jgi:hypothetical protein